jgi:GTPase SAR1 family protein
MAKSISMAKPVFMSMKKEQQKLIIGITGKKGSGKSTVANYLTNTYDFNEYAFANTLKSVCMEVFQLQTKQLYGSQRDKERIDDFWKVSARKIMQEVGTAFREIGNRVPELDGIWIKSLHREIELKNKSYVVISDVRYQDEVDSILTYKENGWDAIIIKIDREINETDSHESENQTLTYDYLINNNGLRKDLFNNVDDILKDYNLKKNNL